MSETDAQTTMGQIYYVAPQSYAVTTDPNDSVRQRIVDVIDTRLQTITTGNGYTTDAGNNVKEWQENPFEKGDQQGIDFRDVGEEIEDSAVGEQWHTLYVEVRAFGYGSTATDDGRKVIADIIQCMGTDLEMSTLAEDTRIVAAAEDFEVEHEDRRYAGILLRFAIEYATDRFDVYA